MTFERNKPVSVELCMISTPDGIVDVGGKSGPLGGATDREVLLTLREHADIVLVGAGTVRAENYGPPQRAPLPIVVVTNGAQLDFSSPLFTSGWAMVATTTSAPEVPVRSFRVGETAIDFSTLIKELHAQLNAKVIHVEGGPQLNASLLEADVVDAINITMSPYIGNGGQSITAALSHSTQFSLTQLCRDDDFLFARYERVRN